MTKVEILVVRAGGRDDLSALLQDLEHGERHILEVIFALLFLDGVGAPLEHGVEVEQDPAIIFLALPCGPPFDGLPLLRLLLR